MSAPRSGSRRWGAFFRRGSRHSGSARQTLRRLRLRVEALEDRCLLSATIVDHAAVDRVPSLSQTTMHLVAQQRWFFTHASVGGDMIEGMGDLNMQDASRYKLVSSSVDYDWEQSRATLPTTTTPGTIYECNRGNPGWESKVAIFNDSIDAGWHDGAVDVVLNKFCFIDQDADASSYLSSMATMKAAHPYTAFVYATMPLTTSADADNILRNQFNDAVRSYCSANQKLLFDIADIEAHDPSGNAVTFSASGQTYQRLYSGYTTDGGHLNDDGNVGRDRVALGWYAMAAEIAGTLRPTTPGLFDPATSTFYLRNSSSTGAADYTFGYGDPTQNWKELVGDWDGDGGDTIGFFDPATCTWYLRNALSAGYADWTFGYGDPSLTQGHGDANWVPLVGDWDGNGTDTIGFFDPATCTWFLRNSLTAGYADSTFGYGDPALTQGQGDANWLPLVGDWDGNHTDTIGFFAPATCTWFLRDSLSTGFADHTFACGDPSLTVGHEAANWVCLIGNWDGTEGVSIGFFDPQSSTFMLRNSLSTGMADLTFGYGSPAAGWIPLVGTWQTTPQATDLLDACLAESDVDYLAALGVLNSTMDGMPPSSANGANP